MIVLPEGIKALVPQVSELNSISDGLQFSMARSLRTRP